MINPKNKNNSRNKIKGNHRISKNPRVMIKMIKINKQLRSWKTLFKLTLQVY